jgi:NitT/TauT family transport system ATP-binding protein
VRTATLTLETIGKRYLGRPILQGVSFTGHSGEIVALIGKSGCGKSTLLNIVAGLLAADDGKVLTADKSQFGFMQQTPQLLPYRTALQNACLTLELRSALSPDSIASVVDMLAEFDLRGFEDHYPAQLSGGMQQRIAFARTLATGDDILLCDEPFSAIDFEARLELEALFRRHVVASSRLALFVTHDIDAAVAVADRVLVLGGTPATIKATIAIERGGDASAVLPRDDPAFHAYSAALWQALGGHA